MTIETESKICPTCNTLKVVSDFYRRTDREQRYMAECKTCHTARMRNYRTDRSEERRREQSVVAKRYRLYGLTDEQFWLMYEEQAGVCANPGCHRSFDELAWHIDHDHGTGDVRGLLCENCNRGLGMLQDEDAVIQGLSRYHNRAPRWPAVMLRAKGDLCKTEGCLSLRLPNRRLCAPCRAAEEKAKRVTRKASQRTIPCSVEGCEELRHETPSQVLPWCRGHRDARLGRGALVLEEPRDG